jgi:sortase A
MAYVYMPLLFTSLGYIVIYIAAVPVISMLQATGSMVIANEVPDFNRELKSIYNRASKEEVEVLSQVAAGTVGLGQGSEAPSEEAKVNNVISIKDIQFPEHGTHFANLSCERIELNAPVYWGDTNEVLKAGVGQYMGSFLPGFGRTILLSGHNTTYFKPLQLIEVGDVIAYNTNYGDFQYKVTDVQVLPSSDARDMQEDLLSNKQEELIMYTCYPFETLVGTKQDRLFVFADKISGPTVE